MRGLLAVAAMALKKRWSVLVAAFVAGLLALAVPFFSALGRHDVREARDLAALIFAAAFACGVAVVIGGGMITRELAERRHGFLFARPLSGGAIWGGNVLACWLLAVGSGLAVLLPAAAVSRGGHLLGAVSRYGDVAATLGIAMAAVLGLILYAHAVALMVRSRTPWLLALDAVLAVAVATAGALALRSLFLAYALDALTYAGAAIAVATLVAPLIAGFAQVSRGRTDSRRGHQALSTTLWSILGVTALLVAGYARWVQAVGMDDLTRLYDVLCAPKGNWTFVAGQARGRGDFVAWFLVDTASGRTVRVGGAGKWWLEPAFSEDGTRAVWLSPPVSAGGSSRTVLTLDLTVAGSQPVTTPINIVERRAQVLGLSPDGRRIAVREGGTVSVLDLLSGNVVAAARLPVAPGAVKVLWPGPQAVRFACWQPGDVVADQADVHLFELDLVARKLTETGRIEGVERRGFWSMGFDRERGHIVTSVGPRAAASVVLCDARSGARIAALGSGGGSSIFRVAVLSDGMLAVGEFGAAGAQLGLFSSEGVLRTTVRLGDIRAFRIGPQPAPGILLGTAQAHADDRSGQRCFLVDLRTGAVRFLNQGYSAFGSYWWFGGVTAPSPGSVATRAFVDPAGCFVLLDPDTNTFRAVLAARWYAE